MISFILIFVLFYTFCSGRYGRCDAESTCHRDSHVAHVTIGDGIAIIRVQRTFHNKGDVAEVAFSNHGILLAVSSGYNAHCFMPAVRELVRPDKIEYVEIVAPDGSDGHGIEYPSVLHEGDAIRHMSVAS